ncbi:hypothetical protein Hanom_Chr16g01487451 [Helianthus anomalus]
MAPGKENMSASVSILNQRQLKKFVREYRTPPDLHPVLPSKDETIYPFRQGKFPFYTRVCNFANYRVPFSRFFIRYFYEFITAGDWYTFAHRKGISPPSSDERSSLKTWKDNFFWLDDSCLPEDMRWRFKDQSMSFDLGEDFVFDQELVRAQIEHKSPVRPLHEHFLLLGRLCFSWSQVDRDWPVIHRKRDRVIMSLRDALKVPCFDVLDFDLDDQGEGEVLLMKQVAPSAQEIQPVIASDSPKPTPTKGAAGSSGSQAGKKSILDDVDSDPEVRSLDEALQYRPSSGSLKSKGIMHEVDPQALVRKRKTESVQIRSSDPLPMLRIKKIKKGSSHSGGDVMVELDEHLTGGKFSREEAARARSEPTPTFSGKTHDGPKALTFSGTILDSSLGLDRFLDDEEDQVFSLPPSWFGPELMSFFRYADVFSDDMEIDPATAEEKFVLDWDIRNKDSVMDELVAKTLLFNISTPLDHARGRRMKNQDLSVAVLTNQAQLNFFVTEFYRRWVEAESVRENLERETRSLKRKVLTAPDTEKKIAQLTQDLQSQQEKIKFLTTQNQSSQAATASAVEDRDRISAELKKFPNPCSRKMKSTNRFWRRWRSLLRDGWYADLKAQIEEMKGNEEGIKAENATLQAKVEDLQATKTWLL